MEPKSIDRIFWDAAQLASQTELDAYLHSACGADVELRKRVEQLLKAQVEADNLFEAPFAADLAAVTDQDVSPSLDFLTTSERPGALGRIGHFEVLEVIGHGGMGVVLRALDERLHRVVAIKVMAKSLASCATARKRFIREAQAAAAVSHDHIVTIHAVEEVEAQPYLVMHFVEGVSLQQRIDRDGPLDLQEILRIGMQTASGLAAAHSQGVVHRDIKPANILLENGVERVKITDFGLARAAADAGVTQTGVVVGTPWYMAPEQARGERVDQRSDLFSLGSVLYAMCTGRAPFRASSVMAVLKRVCDDAARPISESNPEIPDWLVAIIAKLHAKDPVERFQSAAEVAGLLAKYLAHVQHPSVAQLPAAAAEVQPTVAFRVPEIAKTPPKPQRARWMIAAAAVFCLLGGFSLTEATGVTNLATTVIRVITPDGTLVVETGDSAVKVTVEGDGGLVIYGDSLDEIRLRPGSYKVHADRDGRRVPLEKELVSIARGGREVVKVKLEGVSAQTAVNPETGAFVVVGGQGVAERKFDSLAAAVLIATDGDTIEIRGNGPFLTQPILIHQALTIRAGDGFRPVVRITPGDDWLIATYASLVLEGLDIREVSKARSQPALNGRSIIYSDGKSLYLANCRLLQEQPIHEAVSLIMTPSIMILRNCEFHTPGPAIAAFGNDVPVRFVMDNCLALGNGSAAYLHCSHASNEASVEFRRNTFVTRLVANIGFSVAPDPPPAVAEEKRVRFEASANVFDIQAGMLMFDALEQFRAKAEWQKAEHVEAVFTPLIGWREKRNLYTPGATSIYWSPRQGEHLPFAPGNLKDWQRRWNLSETGSFEGTIRFHGGNLLVRATIAPDKLTPEDFRLRSDSAGYRAGQDGKDLGADVDLVGPGPAYERWKKTPEYQVWLRETGHGKE